MENHIVGLTPEGNSFVECLCLQTETVTDDPTWEGSTDLRIWRDSQGKVFKEFVQWFTNAAKVTFIFTCLKNAKGERLFTWTDEKIEDFICTP